MAKMVDDRSIILVELRPLLHNYHAYSLSKTPSLPSLPNWISNTTSSCIHICFTEQIINRTESCQCISKDMQKKKKIATRIRTYVVMNATQWVSSAIWHSKIHHPALYTHLYCINPLFIKAYYREAYMLFVKIISSLPSILCCHS